MAASKSLRTLLLKCLLLALLVLVSYGGLLYLTLRSSMDQNDYFLANVDKMQRLVTTRPPRMIFIGGSNLAFGLDSAAVSKSWGMPVVNMGLSYDLGLKFMLDHAAPYLRQGDLVVVVPEYQHFFDKWFWGRMALLRLLFITDGPFRPLLYIPSNTWQEANSFLFNWKPEKYRVRDTKWGYNRHDFNQEGDEIGHLKQPDRAISFKQPLGVAINHQAISYLARFIAANNRRGITTLVVYPSLQESYYRANAVGIQRVAEALRAGGVPVLGSPQSFVFADNLFFDSIYHLNAAGRQLRTQRLIRLLHSQ